MRKVTYELSLLLGGSGLPKGEDAAADAGFAPGAALGAAAAEHAPRVHDQHPVRRHPVDLPVFLPIRLLLQRKKGCSRIYIDSMVKNF